VAVERREYFRVDDTLCIYCTSVMMDVSRVRVRFTARISPVVIDVAVERAHVGNISELMVHGRGAIPTANETRYAPRPNANNM
jgi:hypothetical protein